MRAVQREFSVIIPAYEEATRITKAVRHIRDLDPSAEIIVADGGSRDGTRDLAAAEGAVIVRSRRGRGTQCAAGARLAAGRILIFLHADTLLPDGAFPLLRDRFADPEVRIGTFRLRFDRDHWLLRAYALMTRLDSLLTSFGDQGIVVRAEFYRELGGFPDWKRLEDVHLLRRARRRARVHTFPATVVTSARRFEQRGMIRTQLRNALILAEYLLGAPGRAT